MLINLVSFAAVFLSTYFGVRFFRHWSLQREYLDIPNQRSSHTQPTPHGGGLVICFISLICFIFYCILTKNEIYWTYIVGSILIAGISWIDDLKNISPFLRILFHFAAAGLIIWSFGGFTQISLPFYGTIILGFWGDLIAFLWIVWLINAYNFMDGIDGIAASQAVIAGIGWSFLGFICGMNLIGFYGGVLAFSGFGFLILNWQPAEIFMGDVGSAFLGYTFAVLPFLALRETHNIELQSKLFWIGIVFVWFFVFDSIFTFIRRVLAGEKIWQPHRRHIYQNLVSGGFTHSFVSLLYAAGALILVFVTVATLFTGNRSEIFIIPALIVETLTLLTIWIKKGKSVNVKTI